MRRSEIQDRVQAGVGEGVVDGLGGFGVDGDDADVDVVLADDRRELVPRKDFDAAAGAAPDFGGVVVDEGPARRCRKMPICR